MSVATNGTLLTRGLKELADELNLAMLRQLRNGPATCMELAKKFQRGYSVIWRRLEKLREAGLVQRGTRQGKTGQALYVALKDKVRAFFDGIMKFIEEPQELPG